VKRVKAQTGCKIVQLQHCDEYIKSDEGFADYAPYNVGPKEFVRLIRDAEYVFTDSFHCTVFSLLHQKRFFTFRRYNTDSVVSTNGRLYSLLSLVGLENRLKNGNEDVSQCLGESIDFAPVHQKLSELRQFTWQFLESALEQAKITQMSIYKEGTQVYHEGVETDVYLRSFFSDMNVRPSCYACKFKKRYRLTDFTLWDCFDVYKFSKEMDNNKGVTRILAHTERAVDILRQLSEVRLLEIDADKAVAGVREMTKSVNMNPRRKELFKELTSVSGG